MMTTTAGFTSKHNDKFDIDNVIVVTHECQQVLARTRELAHGTRSLPFAGSRALGRSRRIALPLRMQL